MEKYFGSHLSYCVPLLPPPHSKSLIETWDPRLGNTRVLLPTDLWECSLTEVPFAFQRVAGRGLGRLMETLQDCLRHPRSQESSGSAGDGGAVGANSENCSAGVAGG